MMFIQPQEGVCGVEEVEMEIEMEEEVLEGDEDGEFSSDEEEVEEAKRRTEEVTSPAETKMESIGSLGFSTELSSILANKMSTLNNSQVENAPRGNEGTKEKESVTKETGKSQQRRKPPPPPTKPKV